LKSRPAGDYIIGVDSDQDAIAPGKVLTSALKHVDNAVLALANISTTMAGTIRRASDLAKHTAKCASQYVAGLACGKVN